MMKNKNDKKEKRLDKAKPYINLGITFLVELFTHAVCTTVMQNVDGGKFAKFGARIGASLVGFMIGEQVTDCICDSTEEFLDTIDELKDTIEEAEHA